MSRTKVLILGASGMLGYSVSRVLTAENSFEITLTAREIKDLESLKINANYNSVAFDAENSSFSDIKNLANCYDYIVNCIGIIKPYIIDSNSDECVRAIKVNSLFPHMLAASVKETNSKVIQIATDCVYSGFKGKYNEADKHDALDVYGKSKSLGEVYQSNFFNLRCSIIGPQLKGKDSLLNWFLKCPQNSELNGFTHHLWNGVTTLAFGKIVRGIIRNKISLPNHQHIVPEDVVTKYQMLNLFAQKYNRTDLIINESTAGAAINRTLATQNSDLNKTLWSLAGYQKTPTVWEMINELE